jgi:hypothetical protein
MLSLTKFPSMLPSTLCDLRTSAAAVIDEASDDVRDNDEASASTDDVSAFDDAACIAFDGDAPPFIDCNPFTLQFTLPLALSCISRLACDTRVGLR